MKYWVITLHGVDADGVQHAVVHRLPAEIVKVTKADVGKVERQGLVPGPWVADQKSFGILREWKDSAQKDGFYSQDGKHCTFTAIDSTVIEEP